MTKIFELKELIKSLSKQQKVLRPQRKESFEGIRNFKSEYSFMTDAQQAQEYMRKNKYALRHYHIAYCMLLGTPYELIENKVSDGNAPSWSRIETIKKEYTDAEVIRLSA